MLAPAPHAGVSKVMAHKRDLLHKGHHKIHPEAAADHSGWMLVRDSGGGAQTWARGGHLPIHGTRGISICLGGTAHAPPRSGGAAKLRRKLRRGKFKRRWCELHGGRLSCYGRPGGSSRGAALMIPHQH